MSQVGCLVLDAEPKYLIAVQPIPANEVKKQCTGRVQVHYKLKMRILPTY